MTKDLKDKAIDLSYLAGLLDGEGYLGIRRCSAKNDGSLIPEFKPTMVIVNTNLELMIYLKERFYGSINTKNNNNKNWKQSYSFEFNRTEIKRLLPELKQLLVIKKQQAEAVLKLFDTYKHTYRGNGYTLEELGIKENLHKECLLLNKRGI